MATHIILALLTLVGNAVAAPQFESMASGRVRFQEFLAAGTHAFVPPAPGLYSWACIGGGGGGGYTTGARGGGGGVIRTLFDYPMVSSVTVIIGAGGACNVNGNDTHLVMNGTIILTAQGGKEGQTSGANNILGTSVGGTQGSSPCTSAGNPGIAFSTMSTSLVLNSVTGGGFLAEVGPGGPQNHNNYSAGGGGGPGIHIFGRQGIGGTGVGCTGSTDGFNGIYGSGGGGGTSAGGNVCGGAGGDGYCAVWW